MSENANKDVIEQLERLYSLLEDAVKWNEYAKSGCLLEYGEKMEEVILSVNDLKGTPTVFNKFPVFPMDSTESIEAKKGYESKKKILTFLVVFAVVCVVIFFLTHWSFFNSIASVGIVAAVIFFFPFSQSKKTYKEKEKLYNDSVKKSEDSFAAYKKALGVYDTQKKAGIEAAKAFAKAYKAAYKQYEDLLMELDDRKCAATEKFIRNMEEAKTIDFVPSEYYGLIQPMISMLKSGRADNYKEALNMAIDEERQREAEAARRAEEARRTRIMEEQAAAEQRRLQEAERHNREMEQQQQMQAKMMIEEQRKQEWDAKKAADKARSEQMQADSRARSQALHRCAKCRKRSACGGNAGIPNCGAFDPW